MKVGLCFLVMSFKCLLALLLYAPLIFQERIEVSIRASITRLENKKDQRGKSLRDHVFITNTMIIMIIHISSVIFNQLLIVTVTVSGG